jgi:hypothetical protein
MKILFISKYASGVTRQYLYAKELTNIGHTVKLVYSRSNGSNMPKFKSFFKKSVHGNLETIILNGPVIDNGFSLKRVWSWLLFEFNNFRYYSKIKGWKPDIVLVSSLSILTFVFGVFVKRRLKIPLILEVRDLYPLTLIEVGGLSKKNPFVWLIKQIEKFGYKNADLIISTLENTESYFQTVSGKKINFLWLPMGFSKNSYDSIPNNQILEIVDTITELKTQGKFVVAYAGTVGLANALEELMATTIDSEISQNNIHFVFIGDGPLKKKYQEKYRNGSCTFFSRVEKKFVPQILKHCDLLINTWLAKSIYRFGVSPNKWIEYMYAGRPILLALNATSKIFNEAQCGWQIPAQNYEKLKEAILHAKLEKSESLDELGLNGKNYLIKYLSYETLSTELSLKIEEAVKNK